MKNRILQISLFGLVCFCSIPMFGFNLPHNPPNKPNIILIYIDDLGYSDVGCYGSAFGQSFIETPNIDKFAKEGIRFTNAYAAAPLCSPSRAGLLTGKTPARLGFEFVTKYENEKLDWNDKKWIDQFSDKKLIPPPFTLNLPLEEKTVAEVMEADGYNTALVGKWHVAAHYKHYDGWNPEYGPAKQGFEWTFETFGSHPYGFAEEHTDTNRIMSNGEFPVDEITTKAIEYIKSDHPKPFFLMVDHYYVHTPLDKRAKWLIDKYQKKATTEKDRKRAKYAAFVETMDHYVGQLLEAINTASLSDNTIVIFTSDNGGHPQFAYNRPFRGSKWNLYEGGIRIPLIVRWPGVAPKSTECSVPVSQTDFLPTFNEIGGGDNKSLYTYIDGRSVASLFKGDNKHDPEERSFVWHFPYYHPEGDKYNKAPSLIGIEDGYISRSLPQSAIRKGRYKAIYFYDSDRLELYDLVVDPSEQHDISKDQAEKATMLKKELFDYLKSVHARFPRPHPL